MHRAAGQSWPGTPSGFAAYDRAGSRRSAVSAHQAPTTASATIHAATKAEPFPQWRKPAERFGVTPRTVEDYIAAKFTPTAMSQQAINPTPPP